LEFCQSSPITYALFAQNGATKHGQSGKEK
jgi:hypothetical protein